MIQKEIEAELRVSTFVTRSRPLTWFKVVDALVAKAKERCFQPYDEVSALCATCGIELTDEIPRLLRFLHEMGSVFWLQEETLRDFVILDVVKAFVKPAALLICKHQPCGADQCDGCPPVLPE